MQLLQGILRKSYNFILSLTKRNYRDCAVLMVGIVIIAVVVMGAVGFSGSGKNKVYAVQNREAKTSNAEEEDELDNELQAGLMGIVSSVNRLEEYSQTVSSISVANAYEDILVGTTKLNRNEMTRLTVERAAQSVGGIGYYARQTVRNHHMPKQDYDSLLQIVEAEATGGDMKSKILVANVVLNRVKDDRFPNTIYNVIWERVAGSPQFSPTADGRIYSVAITNETYDAVDRALAGEDYSEGALFFVARDSADCFNVMWFDETLLRIFEYGGHEYYTFAE